MDLADATWTDINAVDTDLALLPVGSTEQHGPHAPLGTDTITARSIAETAAEAADDKVIVAPPIPVAIAEEHRHFPGTLWVSPDTFRSYVRETIESLAHHGWDRVVVVNGHGGNVGALRELCERLTRRERAYAMPFTWFEAVDEHAGDMGHGGPLETALLRHVAPDLVRERRAGEAAENGAERWGEWVSHTNLAVDSAEFTENGVVGDPTDGDADRGERLLALASAALVELLEAIAERDLACPIRR